MRNKYAFAFAAMLYLAMFGSSIAWLVSSSAPGTIYSVNVTRMLAIWYWSSSAVMNLCVPCLISARLWVYRQAISQAIGSQRGGFYLAYLVMTLESAILYVVCAIAALAMVVENSLLQHVFFPVLGVIQMCVCVSCFLSPFVPCSPLR